MRCFCRCQSGKTNLSATVLSGVLLLFVLLPIVQSGKNHNGGTKTPHHGQVREAITGEPHSEQYAEKAAQAVDADSEAETGDETVIIDESYLEDDPADGGDSR